MDRIYPELEDRLQTFDNYQIATDEEFRGWEQRFADVMRGSHAYVDARDNVIGTGCRVSPLALY